MGMGQRASLAVVALIVLFFVGSWAIDMVQVNAMHLTARVTPAIVPADGQTTATITVRVLNPDGSPRVGDLIDALDLSQNPGSLLIYRKLTDARGVASFSYTPAMANPFTLTVPARIQITDSSLGRLVRIEKTIMVRVDAVDPSKVKKGNDGSRT